MKPNRSPENRLNCYLFRFPVHICGRISLCICVFVNIVVSVFINIIRTFLISR